MYLLLTALGGPKHREARSFVSEPTTEKVLQSLAQLPPINIEKMLMNIFDEETTIELNEEELLTNTCKTVSSTVSEEKPAAAVPRKDVANVTSLTNTAEIISDVNAAQIESPTVCKITAKEPVYLNTCSDRVRRIAKTGYSTTCLQNSKGHLHSAFSLQDS